jgi:hypothetical protein
MIMTVPGDHLGSCSKRPLGQDVVPEAPKHVAKSSVFVGELTHHSQRRRRVLETRRIAGTGSLILLEGVRQPLPIGGGRVCCQRQSQTAGSGGDSAGLW